MVIQVVNFNLEGIGKSPSKLDMSRILSINEHYIKNITQNELYDHLVKYSEQYKEKILNFPFILCFRVAISSKKSFWFAFDIFSPKKDTTSSKGASHGIKIVLNPPVLKNRVLIPIEKISTLGILSYADAKIWTPT